MNTAQVATLVRALARLRDGTQEDALLLERLADLILPSREEEKALKRTAHHVAPHRRSNESVAESRPAAHRSPTTASARESAKATDQSARSRDRTTGDDRLIAEPSVLELITERADLVTPEHTSSRNYDHQLATLEPLAPMAPLESLFAPGHVRGILREISTLASASTVVDITAVIRLIARVEPLTRLPRRKTSSLGHTVQWLFDSGPAMLPFVRDKQQLAATSTRLLGRDRVRIADFIGHPSQSVRIQRQVQWGMMHWPPRGSALVVVSDLGIGGGNTSQHTPAWHDFLDEARRRGLRSVVLIPYEPSRWPRVAAAFDTALTWDLATGVQGLRRRQRMAGRG